MVTPRSRHVNLKTSVGYCSTLLGTKRLQLAKTQNSSSLQELKTRQDTRSFKVSSRFNTSRPNSRTRSLQESGPQDPKPLDAQDLSLPRLKTADPQDPQDVSSSRFQGFKSSSPPDSRPQLQDPQVLKTQDLSEILLKTQDSRLKTLQDFTLKTPQDVKNRLKTAGFHDASSSRFQSSNISKSSRLETSVGYCSRLKISRRFKLKISRLRRPQVLKTQDLSGILLKNKFKTLKTRQEPAAKTLQAQDSKASRTSSPQASKIQDPQDTSRTASRSRAFKTRQDFKASSSRFSRLQASSFKFKIPKSSRRLKTPQESAQDRPSKYSRRFKLKGSRHLKTRSQLQGTNVVNEECGHVERARLGESKVHVIVSDLFSQQPWKYILKLFTIASTILSNVWAGAVKPLSIPYSPTSIWRKK
ncbi:hypothetical protein B0H13DRAFT_2434603 [Mycena leptocephala]|nr:hypothetical protein B0H13DRAFT_2434603 [Mycena leptocephala]